MINQAALAQGAGGPERRNTMRKRIAVMKGDGIGPEIVNEALKVLETVNGWCRVQFTAANGTVHEGWAASQYITVIA